MCGIVGILGREPVAEEMVEALKRLEYRGYDSAGVATLEGGHLTRRRAEGKLKIVRCGDCGNFTHPPREICRHCQSENVAPEAVAGTATIDSFTVNHQKWAADMEVPFVIARVKLDGVPGVYLTTNIVNCDIQAIAIGMRVRVMFERCADVWLPLFEPDPDSIGERSAQPAASNTAAKP